MSTRVALLHSFLDRYASLIINIASSMLIARLLTPAQIGVFSVTMVLLSFMQALRDFGAGQYLLKERELTPQKLRAVWTIQLGVGCAFGLLIAAAARPASVFYTSPTMQPIMYVIALNFLLAPFGSLTYAWLTREMRFGTIAVARFVSVTGGAVVSVLLAWRGWGAISLAWGTLAATLLNILATLPARPGHFPLRPSFRGLTEVVKFGSAMAGTALSNAMSGGSPEMFLGKWGGMEQASYFSRGNGLVSLFYRLILDASMPVVTARMSSNVRETGRVGQFLQHGTLYVLTLSSSFAMVLAFNAGPVVNFLYGQQWQESGRLLPYFSINLVLGMTNALCGAALVAHGRSVVLFRTTLADSFMVVLASVACAPLGLDALCIGLMLSRVLAIFLWGRAVERETGEAFLAYLPKAMLRSLCVAIPAAGPAMWLAWQWPEGPGWLRLGGSAIGAFAMFAFALWITRHPLAAEMMTLGQWLRKVIFDRLKTKRQIV